MRPHFAQVAVIADVIADAVPLDVRVLLRLAAELFRQRERFQHRAGIPLPAADVVDLALPRCFDESMNEAGDIMGMDVVAHLLALVAEQFVLAPFQIALDEIAEKAVQFDAGVIRPGQAAAAQAAGGHGKVPPVFLHHHIAGHFGSAKERMLGLIDRKNFRGCRFGSWHRHNPSASAAP